MAETMRVLAWDETGNRLVPHEVEWGDEVEWKRNGSRGTMRARVCSLGKGRLMIKPPEGRRRWIKAVVSRVYNNHGIRKRQLPALDQ